jgi:hypothetical protein
LRQRCHHAAGARPGDAQSQIPDRERSPDPGILYEIPILGQLTRCCFLATGAKTMLWRDSRIGRRFPGIYRRAIPAFLPSKIQADEFVLRAYGGDGDSFQRTQRPLRVARAADLRLQRRHRHLTCPLTEMSTRRRVGRRCWRKFADTVPPVKQFQRPCFDSVIQLGRGSVQIHVMHILRRDPRCVAATPAAPHAPCGRLTATIEKSKSKRGRREKSSRFAREKDTMPDSRPRSVPTPQKGCARRRPCGIDVGYSG